MQWYRGSKINIPIKIITLKFVNYTYLTVQSRNLTLKWTIKKCVKTRYIENLTLFHKKNISVHTFPFRMFLLQRKYR